MLTLDIPQANSLPTVRAVIRAVQLGAHSREHVAQFTTYSLRHTQYRLHAARILGCLSFEGDHVLVTNLGERLLEADPQSPKERAVFYEAMERSPILQMIAPALLTDGTPDFQALVQQILEHSKLTRSTAERRAGSLLTWRAYVLDRPVAKRHTRHLPVPEPGEQLWLFSP